MTAVLPYPEESQTIRLIPAFVLDGLSSARVSILTRAEVQSTLFNSGDMTPLAAVEVYYPSAQEFTKDRLCHQSSGNVGLLSDDRRAYVQNDMMSRLSVYVGSLAPTNGVQNSELMPRIQFQFRASTGHTPGDVRFSGLLNPLDQLTFVTGAGFVGKTGGILASRWEVWGQVLDVSPNNLGPVTMMLQLCVDRIGDVDTNVFGNGVIAFP